MTYVRRHPPPNKPVCGKMPTPRRGMRRPVCADAHSCRPRLYFGSALFSLNTKVDVTGMTVTTEVSSNLLIATDALGSTTKQAESNFATLSTQTLSALLEPVSTEDGKAFFYSIDANAAGEKIGTGLFSVYNASEVPTTAELTSFNSLYSTSGAVGYIDYVFQLKATNSDTANARPIKVTKLDLTYTPDSTEADNVEKAHRIAFFVENMGEIGTAPAGGSGSLVNVYAPTGAAYNNSKTVDSTNAVPAGDVPAAATATIASVPAGKTNYYKVVVRLWIEGQDTTCTSANFMDLTGTNSKWALDIELKLDTVAVTNTGVTVINKA